MPETIKSIGFGCVGLTAQSTVKKANHLLDTAFKEGIRLFDTAPLYGDGYSEVILGNFIKDKRAEVVITTKFGLGNNKIPVIPGFVALPLNSFRKSLHKRPDAQGNKMVHIPELLKTRKISKDEVRLFLERSLSRLKRTILMITFFMKGSLLF